MPVTFTERDVSRETETGPNRSVELRFTAHGSDDDLEIRSEAESQLPASYDGLSGRIIRVLPIVIRGDDSYWDVVGRYTTSLIPGPPEVGQSEFSFEVGTTTTRILRSIETIAQVSASGYTPAPDFKQAINVDDDGVHGVDILTPEGRFAERHFLADSMIDGAYRGTLLRLAGTVNGATWRGEAKGQILFVGARGRKRQSDSVWEIEYNFAFSANATGIVIGDVTVPEKEGWQYLWTYAVPESAGGTIIPTPRAAYVERVYPYGDFSLLGLGP
ncbi:MAG TPA: hypothetical protein PKC43_06250 [Phycisphaerales bacterium]|nr:hypothetical protein [Phycisphaerales bacterium]HMP37033.1 hypothetical protein [Phycisphaerales bacterium]